MCRLEQLEYVHHRSDDLEIQILSNLNNLKVAHRIDDLEIQLLMVIRKVFVAHRLDDLKEFLSKFKTTCFVVKRPY